MTKEKICDLGGKKIKISADTKLEFRAASDREIEESYWEKELDSILNMNAWISLENAIKNYSDEKSILESFIDKSIWSAAEKEKYRKDIVDCDASNIPLKIINTSGEGFGLCRRVKVCYNDEYGDLKYDYAFAFTRKMFFPIDYLNLLYIVEEEIRQKKLKYPPRKKILSKKMGPGAYDSRLRVLETAIESNREYFNQFKRFMTSPLLSEKIRNYNDSLKNLWDNENNFRALIVDDEVFYEYFCGFDIEEKYAQIKNIIFKLSNSNDLGENEVDYVIKWCVAELGKEVVEIKKNCESKYRYDCILLAKSDFIDEAQEYDHILVCDAGIILIETKNWKGRVEIRPDGKWLRYKENDRNLASGIESPAFQMHRHELLMKKILPNVPIYSVLCFTNNSVILDGTENFSDFPIVYIEKLKEKLSEIILSGQKNEGGIDYLVTEIERHKIYIVEKEDVDYAEEIQ